MNHYINLLESSEILYINKVQAKPIYKLVGMVAVLLLLAWFGMRYMKLKAVIDEGNRIQTTWQEIEKDVETAKRLNEQKLRLAKARQTLEGWKASRHDWPAVMDYIVNQTPVPLEDMQITRLAFDETMQGLRNQVPGAADANFHPLKRQISIQVRGILASDRPERMLRMYQGNLKNGEAQPSPVNTVNLDPPVLLRDAEGAPINQTQFVITIDLQDREVLP